MRVAAARCVPVVVLILSGVGAAHADPDDAGARPWPSEERARSVERGYPFDRTLSPITPEIAARLREIAQSADRRDDVFAKVGDSMSQSRAFLSCFAWGRVDLGGRAHLRETMDFFGQGNAGGVDPFQRDSEATQVGWRTMSVLRGPLNRELRQTRPRFATLMFGTNDMQSGRPWIFAQRLWRIVDRLVENGTIPIMSSILPRDDDARRDRQVPLYSMIARAIAEHRGLPFIDYRREMERLPSRGLARDGLHANVRVEDGRSRPCDFTEEGLRYGHNVRNLLHLKTLDRLRRVVLEGEPAPDPSWPDVGGEGTERSPFRVDRIPYSAIHPVGDDPDVYRIRLAARSQLHVRAFVRRGGAARVRLEPVEVSGAGPEADVVEPTEASGRAGLVAELPAGSYRLIVTPPPAERHPNQYMLLVDRLLPDSLADNPFTR